ncbi:MAG: DUF2061 domain-containing protein [Wenyingzhuangia sp.]|jgi:uncharacterized membrane protein|uniref:DUF2061 domain-containing protein n=1 Tax=Wenyingzhuangia sp. TaxID=1964193 RepID=UPI00321B0EFF
MITEKIIANRTDLSYRQSASSDSPVRSVIKAVSWRCVGTIDTLVVSWFVVEDVATASAIASIDFVTKMILYFFHERAWNSIKWGKK